MLFDVAAFLITSATAGHAAEAFGVPVTGTTSTSIAQTLATSPQTILPQTAFFGPELTGLSTGSALTTPQFVGASVPVSTFAVSSALSDAQLGRLDGTAFLQGLASLPGSRIEGYVSAHAGRIDALLAEPPAASEVDAFWTSTPADAQQNLIDSAPRLIGNLDGIAVAARDQSLRLFMSQSKPTLTAEVDSTSGRALAEGAKQQLHMLGAVSDALVTPKGDPKRSMLSLDLRGQGKASIVVGNLATADYVTYMVPGMFFKVDGQIDDWADDATDLYQQQKAWLKQFGLHKSVAVVAWMGYQTPDLTNIGSLDLAYQGRDALAHSVEALQTLREQNEPFLTIVAHSYGSTAALMALTEYDFSVDALALVGSPGSAAQSVDELHVNNANVYVGAAAWDPVPNSAWFGSDPASPSYGAKPMGVNGETDPITGKKLSQSFGHNEYFAPGSESMRNMALIGVNMGWLVDDQ